MLCPSSSLLGIWWVSDQVGETWLHFTQTLLQFPPLSAFSRFNNFDVLLIHKIPFLHSFLKEM